MAFAYVKDTGKFRVNPGTVLSPAFTGTPASGSLVVLVTARWHASTDVGITTITDNGDTPSGKVNAWQRAVQGADCGPGANFARVEIWYATIEATRGTGNFTLTVTGASSASYVCAAAEFSSGTGAGGDRDKVSQLVVAGTTTVADTGTTVANVVADELAVAVAMTNAGSTVTWTINNTGTVGTYTNWLTETDNSAWQACNAVYRILSSSAGQRHVWIADGNLSDSDTGSAIALFRESPGSVGSQAGFSRHFVP